MWKWKTSQNDALGVWELIPDENIEVKDKFLFTRTMLFLTPWFPIFFLEKGVDIFLWLNVCTAQCIEYRWDSKAETI